MRFLAPAVVLALFAFPSFAEEGTQLPALCARSTADYVRRQNPQSVLLGFPAEHRPALLRALWGELSLVRPETGRFSERAAEIAPLLLALGEPETEVRRALSELVRRFCDGREAALTAEVPRGFVRPSLGLRMPVVEDLVGDTTVLEIIRQTRQRWGYGDGVGHRFDFDRALRLALQANDRESILRIIAYAAVYARGGDLIPVLDEYQAVLNLDEVYFLLGSFALQTFFQSPQEEPRAAVHLLDEAIEAWGRARGTPRSREALLRVARWLARPTVHDHYVHLWESRYTMSGGRAAARVFQSRLTALRYCGEWTRFERVDSVRWEITTRVSEAHLRQELNDAIAAVSLAGENVRHHALEAVRRAERALRAGRRAAGSNLVVIAPDVPTHLRYLVHILETEQVTLLGFENATPATIAAAANVALTRGDYPNAIRLLVAAARPAN